MLEAEINIPNKAQGDIHVHNPNAKKQTSQMTNTDIPNTKHKL